MSEEGVHPVQFALLGPVGATANGIPLPLGGPRQRTLLALLLLRPGRIVPTDELIEAIWTGEPPDGAATTIRSYVSRLRSALGSTATVVASASGYSIDVAGDTIDAVAFERLIRAADEDLARGRARDAAEKATRALALWRGRAFGDLGDEGPLRVEAERLDELRLHAVEQRFDAEVAAGRAASVVDEIDAAVAQHPYRERLWRLLMLALYHSGRQADALAAYQRARMILDEQLGIEPTPELQMLEGQILRHDLPTPSHAGRRDNLPEPQTTFIGRAAELTDLATRMRDNRLITLTGVGGVGKTRLAIELARNSADLAPDGAVFVDLASVVADEDVARTVARTLEVRQQSGTPAADAVARELRQSRTVLVLDNCEHVRAGVAELVDVLRTRCPDVRIIATSRLPLGLDGETEIAVAPLAIPDEDATPDDLRASDAVRLLVDRVAAARPLGAEDAADQEVLAEAARICRDLDGLPLAIELAAARAKVMSLAEIAGRLDDRFRFLVSWRRVSAARHQTLKQAIDWSYDLLSSDDQRTFAALSVFMGGFTLDAVAAVIHGRDDMAALEAITRLVDASLVLADHRPGAANTRYRMLETVRQYGAERSREMALAGDVRSRHAAFYRDLAAQAEPELSGPGQETWFTRLDHEHANFAAALAYLATEGADTTALLEFTVALTRFWYVRGHLAEARDALQRALRGSADAPTLLRRRALTAAASIALLQGNYAEATRHAEASLEAARETGEDRLVANGLSNLGAIVLAAGDNQRAQTLLEEAVALARTVGDTRILALSLNNLGDHALTVGEYDRSEPLFTESLSLLEERGDTANVARSLFNLGAVALMTDRLDTAADRLRESLKRSRAAGDKEDLAWGLLGLACLASSRGESERAAVLLGAATNLLEGMGADFKPFERKLHDETAARLAAQMGDEPFRRSLADGRALSLTTAVEVAAAA